MSTMLEQAIYAAIADREAGKEPLTLAGTVITNLGGCYIGEWHEGAKANFWQVRVHGGNKPHYLYTSSQEVAAQFKKAFNRLISFRGFDLGELTLGNLDGVHRAFLVESVEIVRIRP